MLVTFSSRGARRLWLHPLGIAPSGMAVLLAAALAARRSARDDIKTTAPAVVQRSSRPPN
jgi:hypothetical protein